VGNAVPLERGALLFGFDLGAPAPLEFRRRNVAQRGVAPLGIVVTDVLDDRLPRLLMSLEVHVMHIFDMTSFITSTGQGAPAMMPRRSDETSYLSKPGRLSYAMNIVGTP